MKEQQQTLTMSQKERERLKVLHRLDNGELSCHDAADSLGITERDNEREPLFFTNELGNRRF